MPAAMTSHQTGTALPAGSTGKETLRASSPSSSRRDGHDGEQGVEEPGRSGVHPAPEQVQHAIEEVRPGHELGESSARAPGEHAGIGV